MRRPTRRYEVSIPLSAGHFYGIEGMQREGHSSTGRVTSSRQGKAGDKPKALQLHVVREKEFTLLGRDWLS